MKHRAPITAVGIVTFSCFLATAVAGERYVQDFNRFPDGTTDLGDGSTIASNNGVASVRDGALRLTQDLVNSTHSSFRVPGLGAAATRSFEVRFDFLLASALDRPADGFSVNYGPLPTDPQAPFFNGAGEEGFAIGFSAEVDTWDSGFGENGYNIAVDGVDVPDGFVNEPPPVDGVWKRARIAWTRTDDGGRASFSIDDRSIFEDLPTPGFFPEPDDTIAFSARTGGSTQTLLIDNLEVTAPIRRDPGSPCTLAKLKAARTYAKGVFGCLTRWTRTPPGDVDALADLEECIDRRYGRFETLWQRTVDRLSAKTGCPDGLSFAGVERMVREDIAARYAVAIEEAVPDPGQGKTRSRLIKLGSSYVSKRLAAAMKDLKRPDIERLEATFASTRQRLDRTVERLSSKLGRKGVTIDTGSVSGGADSVDVETDALRGLIAFEALRTLRSRLLAYWDFDEEDGDVAVNRASGGADFNGRLSGDTQRAEGFLGTGSLTFDGDGDFVAVNASPALRRLEGSEVVTISAWVFPQGNGSHPSAGGIIANKEGEFQVARFADGTIRHAMAGPDNSWNWAPAHPVVAPLGEWTHVVVTFQNGAVRVHVNGVAVSHAAASPRGDRHVGQDELWIGDRQSSPQSFHGSIDDVAIWNRPLTGPEITGLFNGGEGHAVIPR